MSLKAAGTRSVDVPTGDLSSQRSVRVRSTLVVISDLQ